MSSTKTRLLLLAVLAAALASINPVHAGGLEKLLVLLPGTQKTATAINALMNHNVDASIVYKLKAIGPGFIVETSEPEKVVRLLRGSLILEDAIVKSTIPKLTLAKTVPREFNYNMGANYSGKGVTIAVVDTGINKTLECLKGKIVGGYDFIDDDNDTTSSDPHGTIVASIIACNSSRFKGVAPGAKLLSYRIFGSTGLTTTLLLVRALDRALSDGADIINLSLGGLKAYASLREVIHRVWRKGVLVVAAVGNDGPEPESISYPASSWDVLGVGATTTPFSVYPAPLIVLNNSLLLTEAIPMIGSNMLVGSIEGKLAYVVHGRREDVAGLNLRGRIAVSLRDHKTYFGTMAKNVAEKGASALIVVNDEEQPFRGRIALPDNPNYTSPIPVFSVSGREGKTLLSAAKGRASAKIILGRNLPAPYSSRGPAYGLYLKPDVVAWGDLNPNPLGYNATGTSFSAPYVSGVLALLVEKLGRETPEKLFSALELAADPLLAPNGVFLAPAIEGAGFVNASTTSGKASLYLIPRYVSLFPSCNHSYSVNIRLGSLYGEGYAELSSTIAGLKISPEKVYVRRGEEVNITVLAGPSCNASQGWLIVKFDGHEYTAPVYVLAGSRVLTIKNNTVFLRGATENSYLEVIQPDMKRYYVSGPNATLGNSGPGYYAVLAYSDGSISARAIVYIEANVSLGPKKAMLGLPPSDFYVAALAAALLSAVLAVLALAVDRWLAAKAQASR